MIKRQIVQIDPAKCDGCGECVPSCEEGAIQIVEGKARLVSDRYCDGLGACLGHCPQDAIAIIEREATPFDEAAAMQHVQRMGHALPVAGPTGGCPGAAAMSLPSMPVASPVLDAVAPGELPSRLANWPVQLHLVPPQAPYLQNADLLLVADCVPFAFADFHRRFLNGKPVLIGCPKLDDGQAYVQKLAQIIQVAAPASISVLHMEVPCCTGLLRIAEAALARAQSDIPLNSTVISRTGHVFEG